VIAHDTTQSSISTSAGLVSDSDALYVQTMDQKVEAQLAGLGIGHLPRCRIQPYLDSGQLVELYSRQSLKNETIYMVWKLANKGKALAAMANILERELVRK
jgi:DNA-binding transcriptional LysR family regulator